MRFISLFAGIGAFDIGLESASWTSIGQIEIDPFCRAVLEKHWPHVPRFGDIKDVTTQLVLRTCGQPSAIVGGFPAPTCPLPAKVRVSRRVRGLGYGGRCSGLSEDCAQPGRSLRTFLLSRLAAMTESSLQWSESATPAGRSWWVLNISARPTEGIGCGSYAGEWPTPQTDNFRQQSENEKHRFKPGMAMMAADGCHWPTPTICGNDNRKGSSPTSGDGLATAVIRWPTPRASENENRQTKPTPSQKAGEHGMNLSTMANWLTPHGMAGVDATGKQGAGGELHQQVQRSWPSPVAADSQRGSGTYARGNPTLMGEVTSWLTPKAADGRPKGNGGDRNSPGLDQMARTGEMPVSARPTPAAQNWRDGRSNQHGKNSRPLQEVVTLLTNWPTPTAGPEKGNGNPLEMGCSKKERDLMRESLGLPAPDSPSTIGNRRGSLNSAWVATLMGLPPDWCELPLATMHRLTKQKPRDSTKSSAKRKTGKASKPTGTA